MNLLLPVVTAQWLKTNISNRDLIILDATLPKVSQPENHPANDDQLIIPGARIFDLKHVFKNKDSKFPNTIPNTGHFERMVRMLGISKYSLIVIYDRHGIYSAPRAWWLFQLMGHAEVCVLNGGLPAWKEAGFETVSKGEQIFEEGDFIANFSRKLYADFEQVLANIDAQRCDLFDARSAGRFNGTSPEPRKGLRGGHIPQSKSLPYTDLVKEGKLISPTEIKEVFDTFKSEKPLIFSCGSGVTACILALAAYSIGIKDYSVFDGSWTEWGLRDELPIVKS